MEKLESKLIAYIRFPLIMGVVFIHAFGDLTMNGVTIGTSANFPINDGIQYLISRIIAGACVPAFLFISGYLFFLNKDAGYVQKIKKRGRTLLIPYLFWNALILLIYALAQSIPSIATLFSGNHKLIHDYGVGDYLNAFWAVEGSDPLVGPFWFIRNLMVLCLLTPIIKMIITHLKVYSLFLFAILWNFECGIGFPGLSAPSLFFFSLGAYFSIHGKSFVPYLKKCSPIVYIVYPLLVVSDFMTQEFIANDYIHKLCILTGIVFFFRILQVLFESGKIKSIPAIWSASFFVFAMHEPFQRFFRKAVFKVVVPNSEFMLIILYFTIPLIVIAIGLVLYSVLSRKTPCLLAFITGGRV